MSLVACQSAYYSAMEKAGIHKRDILVDRVEEAKDTQEEAKEQFKNALEKFKSVRQFDGGELETVYNSLNDEYETSLALANQITSRIESIEDVSEALFEEWQTELDEYSSSSLKQKSQAQLLKTRQQYNKLIRAMKKAESSIQPVLTIFKDQTLYLKHNLNAQAIQSLKGELNEIETNVTRLIEEMNRSIDEANRFIDSMTPA
jgi:hypothetical protein